MLETGRNFLEYLDCFVVYYSIQLGRCVLFSFVVLAVVLLLRHTCFKNRLFLKGMCWAVFLVIPFVGKLKLFYQSYWMVRLFWWWNHACMKFAWVRYGYLAGMLVTAAVIFIQRRRVKKFVSTMKKQDLNGHDVWVGDFSFTPFTTGLIHNRVVLPRIMAETFLPEDLQLVYLHEQTHIRLGHLWLYFLWDIGRILLWINPFLTICMKTVRQDLEDICDQVTIQKSGRSAYEYGKLLLHSLSLIRAGSSAPGAAFAETKDYQITKKRFTRIAEFRPYKRQRVFAICAGGIVAVIGLFCLIFQNSYPNYTEHKEVLILSEDNEFVEVNDKAALYCAIEIGKNEVMVDQEAMNQIFEEQEIHLDSYFILFGGFIKMPGIGGGGNAVYVESGKEEGRLCLSYQNNDTRFLTLLFKWI